MCVTPEPSTKHRMSRRRAAGALQEPGESSVPQGAAGAVQTLGAGGGPGGRAESALMAMFATFATTSRGLPIAKWAVIGVYITYVLW